MLRNVAVRIAEGAVVSGDTGHADEAGPGGAESGVNGHEAAPITIEPKDLPAIIGAKKYEAEIAMRTGQLGDVMKESAQAALSLVKAQVEALNIPPEILKRADIHVHVPAGATAKDGPSAGAPPRSQNRADRRDPRQLRQRSTDTECRRRLTALDFWLSILGARPGPVGAFARDRNPHTADRTVAPKDVLESDIAAERLRLRERP